MVIHEYYDMVHGIGVKLISNCERDMFLEQYIPTVIKSYLEKEYLC